MKRLKVCFIRHGMTLANENGCYCGRVDYELSENGKELIKKMISETPYDDTEKVFSSPLKRCVETAKIIFPNNEITIIEDLQELDFGSFEETHSSLAKDLPNFSLFGKCDVNFSFPNGETLGNLRERGYKALKSIIDDSIKNGIESITIVTHCMFLLMVLPIISVGVADLTDIFILNGLGITFIADENWQTTKRLKFAYLSPIGANRKNMTDSAYVK